MKHKIIKRDWLSRIAFIGLCFTITIFLIYESIRRYVTGELKLYFIPLVLIILISLYLSSYWMIYQRERVLFEPHTRNRIPSNSLKFLLYDAKKSKDPRYIFWAYLYASMFPILLSTFLLWAIIRSISRGDIASAVYGASLLCLVSLIVAAYHLIKGYKLIKVIVMQKAKKQRSTPVMIFIKEMLKPEIINK